jgi:molybdenum cofactor biosynthesis protein B
MSAYEEHQRAAEQITARCAVLTLSDTRTTSTDKSGALVRSLLEADGHTILNYQLLPDDAEQLKNYLTTFLANPQIDAIITNGGTGVSRRDTTVPIIESFIEQPLPGFGELFRMLSYEQIGSGAMLSRAVAGIAKGKLLFALPGSSKAVELAMTKLIVPEIRHLLRELHK